MAAVLIMKNDWSIVYACSYDSLINEYKTKEET